MIAVGFSLSYQPNLQYKYPETKYFSQKVMYYYCY